MVVKDPNRNPQPAMQNELSFLMRSTMIAGVVYVFELFCTEREKRGCVGNASHCLTYGVVLYGWEQGADRESGVSSPIGASLEAATLCTLFFFLSSFSSSTCNKTTPFSKVTRRSRYSSVTYPQPLHDQEVSSPPTEITANCLVRLAVGIVSTGSTAKLCV